MSILFISGLPFGELFWKDVQQRLQKHSLDSHTWTLCSSTGSVATQISELHQTIDQLNISCIVAHGFAIPLALEYSHRYPLKHLVLTNGMISNKVGFIKWILPRLTSIPTKIGTALLSPRIIVPILSSSACFRRLVVNPYVMSREVIQDLSQSQLDEPRYRSNVMEYLQSLRDWNCPSHIGDTSVHLLWGELDTLFPTEQVQYLNHIVEHAPQHTQIIPGGEHFHPVERPWSTADFIADCMT